MYIWSLTYLNSYYIDYKMFRNICLIGLPTAGKSQIGKQLYQHLKMGFIDTDDLIRQKYNREIPELIEPTFRLKNKIKKHRLNNIYLNWT